MYSVFHPPSIPSVFFRLTSHPTGFPTSPLWLSQECKKNREERSRSTASSRRLHPRHDRLPAAPPPPVSSCRGGFCSLVVVEKHSRRSWIWCPPVSTTGASHLVGLYYIASHIRASGAYKPRAGLQRRDPPGVWNVQAARRCPYSTLRWSWGRRLCVSRR
jgi:hypothetical protein